MSSSLRPIAVTGASGGVGTRIIRHLAALGPEQPVRALVRDPARLTTGLHPNLQVARCDYEDVASLQAALRDASSLILVSSDGHADDMLRHHRNVLDALDGSSVEHITYLSIIDTDPASTFFYASGHHRTEALLREQGLAHCFARTSVFADFFSDTWIEPMLPSGSVGVALDDGTISLVTRDDVAQAVAVAAMSRRTDPLSLTGPASLHRTDIERAVVDAFGRPFRVHGLSDAAYRTGARAASMEPWLIEAFATMFATIERGGFSAVSNDVEQLLGRPAESFASFLVKVATT